VLGGVFIEKSGVDSSVGLRVHGKIDAKDTPKQRNSAISLIFSITFKLML